MDDVSCKGSEKSISQCRHRGWYKGNCDHYEDVGVKCHAPKLQGHMVCASLNGVSLLSNPDLFPFAYE